MSRRSFHRRAGVGGLAQNGHGLALRDGLAVQASAGTIADPAAVLANRISDALDPSQANGRVTRLSEMSPEKRAEMERLYGKRGLP
jgi:hypothetical protein